MKRHLSNLFAGILAVALAGNAASAAEIKLLTAGAMRAVVVALLPDFEKQTGHKVTLAQKRFGNAGAEVLKGAWRVPVGLRYKDATGVHRHTSLLGLERATATLPGTGAVEWVYPNASATCRRCSTRARSTAAPTSACCPCWPAIPSPRSWTRCSRASGA